MAESFSEGLAFVSGTDETRDQWGTPNYKYGSIDKTGREIIPVIYDELPIHADSGVLLSLS